MFNYKIDINNWGVFFIDYIGGNWDYFEVFYEECEVIWQDYEDYIKGLCYFLVIDFRVFKCVQDDLNIWGWAKDEFIDNGNFFYQMYVCEVCCMIGEIVMIEYYCLGDEVVQDFIGLAVYIMDFYNCDCVVIYKDGKIMVKNEGNVEVGGFLFFFIGYFVLILKVFECINLLVLVVLFVFYIVYGFIWMELVFMVLA